MSLEEAKRALNKQREPESLIKPKDLLSSGSTLLNLAASGHWQGCYAKGKYYLDVGDSNSGKTWLALAALAEASINPSFNDYRLIYDNGEDGALMNMEHFFGHKLVERLEPPSRGRSDMAVHSETIEELYFHLDDAIEDGRPFVYVQDSVDVLTSEADDERFDEDKVKHRKGKALSGSFGTKAKRISEYHRKILSGIRKSGSILILISQTRDNIGMGAQYKPKTRSGGYALTFYATTEIWFSIKSKINATRMGKPRQLGILAKVHVKRSRLTGRDRTVEIPIYHSVGIDDLGSCVDFLVDEEYWKVNDSGRVYATEFDCILPKEKLIQKIEEENLERDLRDLVADHWATIERACTIQRKNRYV